LDGERNAPMLRFPAGAILGGAWGSAGWRLWRGLLYRHGCQRFDSHREV